MLLHGFVSYFHPGFGGLCALFALHLIFSLKAAGVFQLLELRFCRRLWGLKVPVLSAEPRTLHWDRSSMFNPPQVPSTEIKCIHTVALFPFSLGLYYMKDFSLHFPSPLTPFSKAAAPFNSAHDSVNFNVLVL